MGHARRDQLAGVPRHLAAPRLGISRRWRDLPGRSESNVAVSATGDAAQRRPRSAVAAARKTASGVHRAGVTLPSWRSGDAGAARRTWRLCSRSSAALMRTPVSRRCTGSARAARDSECMERFRGEVRARRQLVSRLARRSASSAILSGRDNRPSLPDHRLTHTKFLTVPGWLATVSHYGVSGDARGLARIRSESVRSVLGTAVSRRCRCGPRGSHRRR